MGNCQVVPKPYVKKTFSDETIQDFANQLKKYSSRSDNFDTTPSTFTVNIYNSRGGGRYGDALDMKLAHERAVKLAFPDKAYIITYIYEPNNTSGRVDMHVSFVQVPDPRIAGVRPDGTVMYARGSSAESEVENTGA